MKGSAEGLFGWLRFVDEEEGEAARDLSLAIHLTLFWMRLFALYRRSTTTYAEPLKD